MFTSWYGQASCTAGRASFMTGRIPIRSALSVVVVPGDENGLTKATPTIAEFFQKNGYNTYFSGKWHLGDQPKFYPIEHGFDVMKEFAAYYPGVYTYSDTSWFAHPWFPKFNADFWDEYQKIVNLYEWEGTAGKPATRVALIDYDYLHEFDVRQADSAVEYIKQHAKDTKPFFMDVNFMKMHNPNIPAKAFIGKSHLGNYSDAMMELDSNIGKVMDAIRAEAPNTIVVITADNGAWQDAWPDGGTVPFRGEKGSPFEGGFRVPGIMWAPGKISAGAHYGEMMSHIDAWATLATMVGLTRRPTAQARTTTASRSISTASTTAPTSWARRGIRRAPHGFIPMVRDSPVFAPTSVMIPRTPTCISPGSTCILLKTLGSVRRRISVPSVRPTTSPWTPSRNTT